MINRKLYKDIKKYDHKQMDDFLTKIYQRGYDQAIDDLAEERMKELQRSQVDIGQLKADLLAIKGIGEVKAGQIVEILENYINCQKTIK